MHFSSYMIGKRDRMLLDLLQALAGCLGVPDGDFFESFSLFTLAKCLI